MSQRWYAKCSVVGCKKPHSSLHRLPVSEEQKLQWINFIYDGSVPTTLGKSLFVCANHFTKECLSNWGQYISGHAVRLILKDGSIPTFRGYADEENAPPSQQAKFCHVGTQTERATVSVGTQLSMKTLQSHRRSTATQNTVRTVDVGVCTSSTMSSTSVCKKRPRKRPRLELGEDEEPLEKSSQKETPKTLGSTKKPDYLTSVKKSVNVIADSSTDTHKIPTYIVYENCLLKLFKLCPMCRRVSDVRRRKLGTFLSVEQRCQHCQFFRKWNSQPILGSTPAGDLQLSIALYATGASFFKIEKMFKAMRLNMFNHGTFEQHARKYIEPAIVHRWNEEQDSMFFNLIQQETLILCGDMRAHSTGHSAKYGSYTMMDLKRNTVVDIQLVQSNEVGGSCHMEKEGLKRSLSVLEARGLTPDSVVTDCRAPIEKYLREFKITHYYDVCGMEKGLSKKLAKISKQKECKVLQKWLRVIKNHMYWTAATSTTGPERVAKWMSILNHVQDIHTHQDPVFPKCLHPHRKTRDRSKWLKAGTEAFYRLEKVLSNKRVIKDIEKLSPHFQTFSVESFHRVIPQFTPKHSIFPFLGTLCRLYLAALHFNENSRHPQPQTSADKPRLKGGECTVKLISTFNYVDDILDLVFEKIIPDPGPFTQDVLQIPIPELL